MGSSADRTRAVRSQRRLPSWLSPVLTLTIGWLLLAGLPAVTARVTVAPATSTHVPIGATHYRSDNGSASNTTFDAGCYRSTSIQDPYFSTSTARFAFSGQVMAQSCNATATNLGVRTPELDLAAPIAVSSSSVSIIAHLTLNTNLSWSLSPGHCGIHRSSQAYCLRASEIQVVAWAQLYDLNSSQAYDPTGGGWGIFAGFGNLTSCVRHSLCTNTDPVTGGFNATSSYASSVTVSVFLNATTLNASHVYWFHLTITALAEVIFEELSAQETGGAGVATYSISGTIGSIFYS